MKYSSHDIPDLPEMAFQRGPGGGIKPQGPGKGGSTPKSPDYVAAAEATSQGNLDLAKYATQANRVNQVTPYGSLTWTNNRAFDQAGYDAAMSAYRSAQNSQASSRGGRWESVPSPGYGYQGDGQSYTDVWIPDGSSSSRSGASNMVAPNIQDFYSGGDNWTQSVQLSPEMQSLFDQQMKLSQGLFGAQDAALGRVNQAMGSGFNMSALPTGGDASQLSIYDPNVATNNATELLMQRMNPELDRQQEALRTQLANQGVAQGSQAYNQAMASFGQQRNDATNQASLQGINLGMQQQGQTYSQNLQKQNLANMLRNNSFQEQSYLRSLPLNELNALRSGSQVQMPEFPGYAQQATTSGTDYTGAAQNTYQSQLGASNAQSAGNSNMMSGLFGLGQMGLMGYGMGMFSDRRLKKNIKRIATSGKGLGVYSFDYIFGGGMVGYMADEVERVSPGAVREVGGLKIVNYAEV
ncbi:hypothetical protein D3C87_1005770 [compost metagenome]